MLHKETFRAGEPGDASFQCQTKPLRRILVAEDDRDIRQINAMVLYHAGYRVDAVEDGAFAWGALQTRHYDLLVTDNKMPRMSGIDLIRKLYAAGIVLPVIMATGALPTWELALRPCLHPAAVLLKPYIVEELLKTVKEVLRKADGSQVFGGCDSKDNKILQAGESASAPLQHQRSPTRRILVVEGEPDIRRLSAEVLIRSGYDVEAVKDGAAGWQALHAVSHAPDSYNLLITDHDMPGLSGLALVKKLRAARMALPVIMATGRLPTEDIFTRYPWLQPAATLIKPYSMEQLLGTVETVLRTTDGVHAQIAPPPNWPSAGGS